MSFRFQLVVGSENPCVSEWKLFYLFQNYCEMINWMRNWRMALQWNSATKSLTCHTSIHRQSSFVTVCTLSLFVPSVPTILIPKYCLSHYAHSFYLFLTLMCLYAFHSDFLCWLLLCFYTLGDAYLSIRSFWMSTWTESFCALWNKGGLVRGYFASLVDISDRQWIVPECIDAIWST